MDNPLKKLQAEPKQRRVPYFAPPNAKPVVDVLITGLHAVAEPRVRGMLETRAERAFDRELMERDVRTLIASGLFSHVETKTKETPQGMIVAFEVVERPLVGYVRFEGNAQKKEKALLKEITIHPGDPLNRFQVEENRDKLQSYYRSKGFSEAEVTIKEGIAPGDKGVVYSIHEGLKHKIARTTFEGNTIVSDARLRTQVLAKPGILWIFGGNVDRDQIDEDLERITLYYRNLGYFRARVSHQAQFDEQHKWLSIKYLIEEGERYRVRNIVVKGTRIFDTRQVLAQTSLTPGVYVNQKQLMADAQSIREFYGNQGYIFADINPQPEFLEQPGMLDLVYTISEGEQYRIGRIFVNIEGGEAHTQRSVVLNRLTFAPGDIVSMKEIRNSELRLAGSQLFRYDPQSGAKPQIVVRPPSKDNERFAEDVPPNESPTYRGQGAAGMSPRTDVRRPTYRGQGGPETPERRPHTAKLIDLHVVIPREVRR